LEFDSEGEGAEDNEASGEGHDTFYGEGDFNDGDLQVLDGEEDNNRKRKREELVENDSCKKQKVEEPTTEEKKGQSETVI